MQEQSSVSLATPVLTSVELYHRQHPKAGIKELKGAFPRYTLEQLRKIIQ